MTHKASIPALALLLAAIALASSPAAAQGPAASGPAAAAVDGKAAFEILKGLAGDWAGHVDAPDGPPGELTYRVSANGHAVFETLFPGTPHEMISVYHMNGPDLVMTHYCSLGNQPRMRLAASTASDLRFAFDGGTNFDPAKDAHIHEGSIHVTSADQIEATWTAFKGAERGSDKRFFLKRKAAPKP